MFTLDLLSHCGNTPCTYIEYFFLAYFRVSEGTVEGINMLLNKETTVISLL
jgi:hypothetical protein